MVVTWWIVAFLASACYIHMTTGWIRVLVIFVGTVIYPVNSTGCKG